MSVINLTIVFLPLFAKYKIYSSEISWNRVFPLACFLRGYEYPDNTSGTFSYTRASNDAC